MKNKTNENNGPCFEVKLNAIRVSVWRNAGDHGDWFNTTITRRYRDGDDWKETNALNGLADLTLALEGGKLARDFIAEQHRQQQAETSTN